METQNKLPKVIEYAWGATASEHEQFNCGDIPYFQRGRFLTEPPSLDAYIPQFRSVQTYEQTESNGIEGKSGLLYRPTGYDFIPFDIDSQDIYSAITDARKLIRWLEVYGVFDSSIYWSGSKGIHICIPWASFEKEYQDYTPLVLKKLITQYIAPLTKISTLDTSVYNNRALFRVPNTRNAKTGFYKIPLTREELFYADIGDLELLSLSDRTDFVEQPSKTKSDYSSLINLFELSTDAVQIESERQYRTTESGEYKIDTFDFIENYISAAKLEPGTRHIISMTLAIYYKAQGYSKDDTEAKVIEFMQRAIGSSTPITQRIREAKNDVKTCFQQDIRFSYYRAKEVFGG